MPGHSSRIAGSRAELAAWACPRRPVAPLIAVPPSRPLACSSCHANPPLSPSAAATPLVALIMPYGQATVLGTTLAAMVPTTAAAVAQHQRCVADRGSGCGRCCDAAAATAACVRHRSVSTQRLAPCQACRIQSACPPLPFPRRLGNISWRLAAGLAAGSVVGGAAGSQAAVHAPPYSLETVFMVTLLALARMTLKSVR